MLSDKIEWEFRKLTQPTAGVPRTAAQAPQTEPSKPTAARIHWPSFFAGAYCAFILLALAALYLRA